MIENVGELGDGRWLDLQGAQERAFFASSFVPNVIGFRS